MRFLKEIIILSIIIIIIIVSEILTSSFTLKSIDEINKKVDNILENALLEEGYEKEIEIEKIANLEKRWKEIENDLAYFIEHDELEKVSVAITALKAYVEADLKSDAYEKMKEVKYRIEHLKAKQKFKLNNMF